MILLKFDHHTYRQYFVFIACTHRSILNMQREGSSRGEKNVEPEDGEEAVGARAREPVPQVGRRPQLKTPKATTSSPLVDQNR